MTELLPDGSTLKPGEVIYRMQTPLRGQTLSVKPGPGQTMEDKAAKGLAFKAIRLVKENGMEPAAAYRRVMGGFKSLSIASEKRAYQFAVADTDLVTQTRPAVDTSALFDEEPQVDAANSEGNFCSVNSLCNASGGAIDYGLAGHLARSGTVKPDAIIGGRPHWKAGTSAKNALAKFKSLASAPNAK